MCIPTSNRLCILFFLMNNWVAHWNWDSWVLVVYVYQCSVFCFFSQTICNWDSSRYLHYFTLSVDYWRWQNAAWKNNDKTLGPELSGHAVNHGVSGDYGREKKSILAGVLININLVLLHNSSETCSLHLFGFAASYQWISDAACACVLLYVGTPLAQ